MEQKKIYIYIYIFKFQFPSLFEIYKNKMKRKKNGFTIKPIIFDFFPF